MSQPEQAKKGRGAKAASTGGPPPDLADRPVDDGDDSRRVAHELLGQAHAVLTIAVREDVLPHWCPADIQTAVADTAARIALAVGEGHAAIASGRHDGDLLQAGIGGELARPKRRGLRAALQDLINAADSRVADQVRAWLKASAGWAKLAVTSIGKSIPGGEVIAEALDVVLSGLDTTEAIIKKSNDRER